jgi:hypothetical protein
MRRPKVAQLRWEIVKLTSSRRTRYESQATFDKHFAAPEYAEFQKTLRTENIIDFKDPVDVDIRVVKHVTGFM